MRRTIRSGLATVESTMRRRPLTLRVGRFVRRIPWRYREYPWLQWSTDEPEGAAERLRASGYRFQEGDGTDLDRLESERTWRDCSLYRQMLEEGRRLYLVEQEGQILSYFFLDFGRNCVTEQVPEIPMTLTPDACFGDEAYTLPAYRGRGVRRLSFLYELEVARREGRRFIVTYYHGDHWAGLATASLTKVGIAPPRRLCTVKSLHFAGTRHTWVTEAPDAPRERGLVLGPQTAAPPAGTALGKPGSPLPPPPAMKRPRRAGVASAIELLPGSDADSTTG